MFCFSHRLPLGSPAGAAGRHSARPRDARACDYARRHEHSDCVSERCLARAGTHIERQLKREKYEPSIDCHSINGRNMGQKTTRFCSYMSRVSAAFFRAHQLYKTSFSHPPFVFTPLIELTVLHFDSFFHSLPMALAFTAMWTPAGRTDIRRRPLTRVRC